MADLNTQIIILKNDFNAKNCTYHTCQRVCVCLFIGKLCDEKCHNFNWKNVTLFHNFKLNCISFQVFGTFVINKKKTTTKHTFKSTITAIRNSGDYF